MHGRILRPGSSPIRARGGSFHRGRTPQQFLWPISASVVALAHLSGAAWLVWTTPAYGTRIPLRSAAVLVFVCLGGWFGSLAYRSAFHNLRGPSSVPYIQRAYWSACGAGLVACYGMGLIVGSHPSAPYVFWISVSVCHAGIWLLLSGSSERLSSARAWAKKRPLRITACTLSLLLIAPLVGEVGLRVYALAVDDSLTTRYVTDLLKLPPGGQRLGQTVNSQGYWDDEFPQNTLRGGLRIAALGDETVLCGDADSNFLSQIERLMPGVEVLNFGVPEASPREYAAQFDDAVAPCRPDVLLVCISVASDITEAPELPGPFDWRSLHLVQRTVGPERLQRACGEIDVGTCATTMPAHCDEGCLDEAARQLQVCRVPVQERLQARWRAVFEHLDRVVQQSREGDVEPILVVLPCDFQIDDRLRETLCRRAGYRPDQIDIDLPQRRLAAYAKDRRVQLLDLMPHLRASRSPTYRCDAAHFNEHGNALTATILCEWLDTQYGSTLLAGGM